MAEDSSPIKCRWCDHQADSWHLLRLHVEARHRLEYSQAQRAAYAWCRETGYEQHCGAKPTGWGE